MASDNVLYNLQRDIYINNVLTEQNVQAWLDWAEPIKSPAAPLILPQEAVIGKIKRDRNRRHRRL